LGAEQSGFIADLGFEAYQKILDEALVELRQGEYSEYFKDDDNSENKTGNFQEFNFVADCHIDTDLSLLLPEQYIDNVSERINLYRRLDNIGTEEELEQFKKELTDRFGDIPKETIELLKVLNVRWLAMKMGMERILMKNSKMTVYFAADKNAHFYSTPVFMQIIQTVSTLGENCKMQEKNNRLILSFVNILTVDDAYSVLGGIYNKVFGTE
jgi:transcription-repair coupling factor (superfamily II helicase)